MLSVIDRVLVLLRSAVWGEAPTEALARVAEVAEERELAEGVALYRLGEASEALWILLEGAVRVEREGGFHRLVGPGDSVGLLALVGDGPATGSATALRPSRVLRIDREELIELLDEDGELARALLAGILRTVAAHHPAAVT